MKRLLLMLPLLAGACADGDLLAPLDGNEQGGVITYGAAVSAATVNAKVEAHCARFGRKPSVPPNAQPFSMARWPSHYQFECIK
jgi:hypothetical protein